MARRCLRSVSHSTQTSRVSELCAHRELKRVSYWHIVLHPLVRQSLPPRAQGYWTSMYLKRASIGLRTVNEVRKTKEIGVIIVDPFSGTHY